MTNQTGNYESAAATKLVATNCCACGRPLVDAVSVEKGMGPDCRKKHGYDEGPAHNRDEANKLVHFVAAWEGERREIGEAIAKLAELGFHKLAMKLAERVATIRITIRGDRYHVESPYSAAGVAAFRRMDGRRFDPQRKTWNFPCDEATRYDLHRALRVGWPDSLAIGPKGPFYVGRVLS